MSKLKQPSAEQLRAMVNLRGNTDFARFLEWLDESLHATDIGNRTATDDRLIRGQGCAQTLHGILKQVTRAPDDLGKVVSASARNARQTTDTR